MHADHEATLPEAELLPPYGSKHFAISPSRLPTVQCLNQGCFVAQSIWLLPTKAGYYRRFQQPTVVARELKNHHTTVQCY